MPLEDANLKQGLLTYALAAEGLDPIDARADLNRDLQIELDEWLSYAVDRLPTLQSDTRVEGLGSRTVIFHDLSQGKIEKKVQEPSLFDFNVLPRRVVLQAVVQ